MRLFFHLKPPKYVFSLEIVPIKLFRHPFQKDESAVSPETDQNVVRVRRKYAKKKKITLLIETLPGVVFFFSKKKKTTQFQFKSEKTVRCT